jgi:hypothetical protein
LIDAPAALVSENSRRYNLPHGKEHTAAEVFARSPVHCFEIVLALVLGQLAIFLAEVLPGVLNSLLGLDR